MCQMCWLLHFLFSTALWNKLYLYFLNEETGDQEKYHAFSESHGEWETELGLILQPVSRDLCPCFATEMQEDAAGPGHLSQKSLCPSHTTIWALGWDQTMTVYHTRDLVTLYHPSQRGTMTLQSQAGSKVSAKVTLLLRCINTIGRPVACVPSCALGEKDSPLALPHPG